MTRVKRGYVAIRRRKRVLERAAGFRGAHSRLFRPTKQQVMKAMVASKRDRDKKREILESFGLVVLMLLFGNMVCLIVVLFISYMNQKF